MAADSFLVVHNKLKEKRGSIPDDVKYFSGEDVRLSAKALRTDG